jgi:hypothetical protein
MDYMSEGDPELAEDVQRFARGARPVVIGPPPRPRPARGRHSFSSGVRKLSVICPSPAM